MDALIVFGLFVVLAVTSLRWGVDSRDLLHATRQDLATYRLD